MEKNKTKSNKGESAAANSDSLEAAKRAYEKAAQAVDATKLAITTEGANACELYENLLSDEAGQPWEKIVQSQMTKCPWEDVYRVTHDETPIKTCDSFLECITFHLLQVFRHYVGKALKYDITSMLKKTNRIPIRQFFGASQAA